MLVRALPLSIAHETAGAARTRHSLRPLIVEGHDFQQNSDAFAPRECEVTFVIPGRASWRELE
jgi:hypothetical protein